MQRRLRVAIVVAGIVLGALLARLAMRAMAPSAPAEMASPSNLPF